MEISADRHQENVEQFLQYFNLRRFARKSLILQPDDASDTLLYILKGTVTITLRHNQQREMVVAHLGEGAFLGDAGFFDRSATRTSYVRAKTDCVIGVISYENLEELLVAHPQFLKLLVKQLGLRLRDLNRKAQNLFFMDVTGRVSHTLLELCKQPDAKPHPDGTQIKISRQEISNLVGASRDMVARVLRTLEGRGMITAQGKTMVVSEVEL